MEESTLDVEWVPLAELRANPANPRRNDEAVPHVAASLARFGWRQPIVAKPSGEIVAGHTRLLAARSLGMERVPVVRFEGSDLEATAYAIADNRTHEFAEWDEPALARLLDELRAEDALEGVGFSGDEIDELLAALEADTPVAEDPGPDPLPEDPVTRPGDLWVLGKHRLLCGDSTRAESFARVLGEDLAALVWTDPPYGVAYTGGTKAKLTVPNDDLDEAALERLLRDALQHAVAACKPGAVWYVAAPSGPAFMPFGRVLGDLGIWRQTLVWVKDSLVLGHSDYHYRHESIFYGWAPGAGHRPPPTRALDTVLEFARPKASADHPTSKPVELVAHGIQQSTRPGELVLDPFAGSGSTLIAAETSRRRCAAIELSPAYCDVIVRRFERLTAAAATCDGRSFEELAAERSTP